MWFIYFSGQRFGLNYRSDLKASDASSIRNGPLYFGLILAVITIPSIRHLVGSWLCTGCQANIRLEIFEILSTNTHVFAVTIDYKLCVGLLSYW